MALRIASTTSGAASAVRARRITLGRSVQAGRAVAPGPADRDRDQHRGDHPDIQGNPARPALGLVLDLDVGCHSSVVRCPLYADADRDVSSQDFRRNDAPRTTDVSKTTDNGQRTNELTCLVLPYSAADGPANMAMDEAMLEAAARGESAYLRF